MPIGYGIKNKDDNKDAVKGKHSDDNCDCGVDYCKDEQPQKKHAIVIRTFNDVGETESVIYNDAIKINETGCGSLVVGRACGVTKVIAGGEWRSFAFYPNK